MGIQFTKDASVNQAAIVAAVAQMLAGKAEVSVLGGTFPVTKVSLHRVPTELEQAQMRLAKAGGRLVVTTEAAAVDIFGQVPTSTYPVKATVSVRPGNPDFYPAQIKAFVVRLRTPQAEKVIGFVEDGKWISPVEARYGELMTKA